MIAEPPRTTAVNEMAADARPDCVDSADAVTFAADNANADAVEIEVVDALVANAELAAKVTSKTYAAELLAANAAEAEADARTADKTFAVAAVVNAEVDTAAP